MSIVGVLLRLPFYFFFFFNDTATTEIYTLSLHDALPICGGHAAAVLDGGVAVDDVLLQRRRVRHARDQAVDRRQDRKSTRLNSSHGYISYAVFCLKKKKKQFSIKDNLTAIDLTTADGSPL